jgi:hypothetical protein
MEKWRTKADLYLHEPLDVLTFLVQQIYHWLSRMREMTGILSNDMLFLSGSEPIRVGSGLRQ